MRSTISIFTLLLTSFVYLQGQQADFVDRYNKQKLEVSDLLIVEDTLEMNVISASRSSKKIGELPITIFVVTREEILRNHYISLTDVVKNLPGMLVSQPGNGEFGESFKLRGLIGNMYTMILVNGLPVKPGGVTGMPVGPQLPVRQAERIEIIYGPAAAIYGADAVSGVINIITREAEKGTFVMGDLGLGLNEYRNGSFMVGGKTGKYKNILQYTFYGGLNEVSDLNVVEGYDKIYNPLQYLQEKGTTFNIGGTIYQPSDLSPEILRSEGINPDAFVNDNYPENYEGSLTSPLFEELPAEGNNLGLHLKFRGISLSYNNMYRRTHSSLGQSPYLFKYNNPQNFWGENIRSTAISYNHEWSPSLTTTTNITSLVYKMDNNSNMGLTFIDYTDKVYRYAAGRDLLFEQLFTIMPGPNLEIMSGITYQYSGSLPQTNFLDAPFDQDDYSFFSTRTRLIDTLSGNFGINPLVFHNVSAFAQAYYSLNRFRFMGGIRIDDNSMYGVSVSPRLAGLFIMNQRTSFRGSVGYAYKAPPPSMAWQSLAYRTGTDPDSLVYLAVPNPGLKPEKFMSVEAGLIRNSRRGLHTNISFYYNVVTDPIVEMYKPVTTFGLPLAAIKPETDSVLIRDNSSESASRLFGVQSTFRKNDLIKRIHLDLELSLTLAMYSDKRPDILEIATDYISNLSLNPNHYGQLKISAEPLKNLYFQISSNWESSWLRVLMPIKEIYEDIIQDYDGYYCMDFVANYRIGANLNGFLKINNIFDEKYGGPAYSGMKSALTYNPQTGRSISLGLTYTLN
ncbi:MAG: TonB-dependent receptor plug domain-containing protein [Bacteroidales bacterium]|nr:TonB-dependent receptor plug domain-containing protein [Bacteroidales bacterium]MBN2634140.1 TonB-dependent receptor plug domain-containing protein [Bacteroidales bacterium]